MNIYASSFRLCSEPSRLRRLFGESTTVAVISNALDFSDDETRRSSWLREHLDQLSALGLEPALFDLRDYFGSPGSTRQALERFDGVFVTGGNVFLLRRAMQYSGFDQLILEIADSSRPFVYSGYSAGSCVLGPTLEGLHLVDPSEQMADAYEPEIIWEGLGLLPYSIAPHFESDHPESERINDVVEYFKSHEMPYRTLHDGEAVVIQA